MIISSTTLQTESRTLLGLEFKVILDSATTYMDDAPVGLSSTASPSDYRTSLGTFKERLPDPP